MVLTKIEIVMEIGGLFNKNFNKNRCPVLLNNRLLEFIDCF